MEPFKCVTEGCNFFINNDPEQLWLTHCCRECKDQPNTHGFFCNAININNKKKYNLIHPTKTGTTSLFLFFREHYKNRVCCNLHGSVCRPHNNPVIVIRDPFSRFLSMYKYWKNGASFLNEDKRERPSEFLEKYGKYTIKDFINLLKINDTNALYNGFTWDKHYESLKYWINDTPFKKIIVIKYSRNLKIKKILAGLGLTNKNIPLVKTNVSLESEEISLDDEDISFIKEKYIYDLTLYDKVINQPSLFKKVI